MDTKRQKARAGDRTLHRAGLHAVPSKHCKWKGGN